MFESGLTRNNVDEPLLARHFMGIDLASTKGFLSLDGIYAYPVKKEGLSKDFQKEEASLKKFYQKVKISMPPKTKKKTLKDIEAIRKNLGNSLKKMIRASK